ncbi:MAG: Ldh family oxidoreductase [Aquamicrobium sp.]|nr:Ldh family oxidoreductase [Aquamicrobium sp.]
MRASADQLQQIAVASLEKRGAPHENAWLQAELLVEAELRGLSSHGLQRLPTLLKRIERGLADPTTSGIRQWRRQALVSIDGERGLGPVVMMAAMSELTLAVHSCGIAIAAIRNANHLGMLAYYAEAAALAGRIGIVMSTSEALVHPYGGTRAMLGTNPIAIGIPTDAKPFVLDLATSIVSMGRIHSHALRGEPIPAGWAVDATGRPTTDPDAAKLGAIAPFGGAKGYGLGLAIELFVASLAGSEMAPEVRGTLDETDPATKGDLLILIDPAAGAANTAALTRYLECLRSSCPAEPGRPVAIPGDGSHTRRAEALSAGVEVPDALFNKLAALAAA